MLGRSGMVLVLTRVFAFFVVVLNQSSSSTKVVSARKDAELLWDSYVPNYMHQFFSAHNQSSNYASVKLGVSEECVHDVSEWIAQLSNFRSDPLRTQTWALHMIDSWGKPPEGILSGHVNSMGDFDECVGLRGTLEGSPGFQGLYCTTYIINRSPDNAEDVPNTEVKMHAVSITELEQVISISSDIMVNPSMANCFPSSCTRDDVQAILTNYFLWINITSNYNVVPSVGSCATDKRPELNAGVIVMIGILVALGLLCVVATAIEVHEGVFESSDNSKELPVSKFLQSIMAFSLLKNTKSLLNTSNSKEQLTCFYGLRFLSMAWIVLMHTWGMLIAAPVAWNLVDVKLIYKENWASFVVHNGLVSVDTFFTMGGLLVTYNILNTLEKNQGRINIPLQYLHRFFRLTPTYALIIGCLATLLPYLSSGPNWYVMDMWAANCRRNWWHNLLYINNLIDYGTDFSQNGMCAGLSWYLSADMQFFLLSPFFVYPLWKWKIGGKILLGLVTLGSVVSPFVIAYENRISPTLITSRANGLLTTKLLYFKPWTRAGPYIVGMWTGYFLFRTAGGKRFKLSKRVVLACWLTSTVTALAVLLGIRSYFDPTYELPAVGSAMYAGLHRFVWGLVVAWVVIACVKGYGGWINSFLSWSFFAPLSRLTFSMYLVSYFIQMIFHLRMRQPFYYDSYKMVNLFFAHLMMSVMVSYVLTIVMEIPFLNLDKIWLRRMVDPKTVPSAARQSINASTRV